MQTALAWTILSTTKNNPLLIPPLQHSQRPERIPPAGLTCFLQIKKLPARHACVHHPAPVWLLFALQQLNCIRHALVTRCITGLEVIQSAQEIIFPAGREGHGRHLWVEDFARFVGFIQAMCEQEFMSTGADLADQLFLFWEVTFILEQTFQH